MSRQRDLIPIWYFIGLLLVAYGILITAAGVVSFLNPLPPEARPVLFELHSGIWWGLVILAAGVFYTYRFSPGRTGGSRNAD